MLPSRPAAVVLALLVALTLAPAATQAAPSTQAAAPSTQAAASTRAAARVSDLASPRRKEIAMRLVSSAENSSLAWRQQYRYIEDIRDGRGYTAGIIGFCSGTGDMLVLVRRYTATKPQNPLRRFLPALRRVNRTPSHAGLGTAFVRAWRQAAADPAFQRAQDRERDRQYFNPAVRRAKNDGLGALGQFAYYDAAVVHGLSGMLQIRRRALERAAPPAQPEGDQYYWLTVFLEERLAEMEEEPAHAEQLDRITKTQQRFLDAGNYGLAPPLRWTVNQTRFRILAWPRV